MKYQIIVRDLEAHTSREFECDYFLGASESEFVRCPSLNFDAIYNSHCLLLDHLHRCGLIGSQFVSSVLNSSDKSHLIERGKSN